MSDPIVRIVTGSEVRALMPALSEILIDCVEGGASVSFMAPVSRGEAAAFWNKVADSAEAGSVSVLVAEIECVPCGTVQIACDTPPNQPHRGDIRKLLVHRRARERGVGRALMEAAEREAARLGRSLLCLDTASGAAERLYTRLGWTRVGVIPDYALWPQGGLCDTTIFFKRIATP